MEKLLIDRLRFSADDDFLKLAGFFKAGTAPVFSAGMKKHFEVAKQKPQNFINHPPVLAISLGGTNLKLMIASMKDGELYVEYARSLKIPAKPTDFFEFFDDLIIRDKQVYDYFKRVGDKYLGFSFPMAVIDGVPYHPTKVPMLNNVILRDINELSQEWNFEAKFGKYLESRGLPPVKLFYQGDGIIAHHGAVSLCDVGHDDSTTLVICGTGLATGDEENYIQMGIAPMIDDDEELYPASETENYQYHYAIAGKGLFGLMSRCIRIKAQEPGSLLGNYDLQRYFLDSEGSKTVIQIWESSLPQGTAKDDALRILNEVGKEAYSELQQIASEMVGRLIAGIASSIVITIVKMGPAQNGKGHDVFFEGSIAVNKEILPRVKQEVERRIRNTELFRKLEVPQPYLPDMEMELKPIIGRNGVDAQELEDIDITLIGAATSIMADRCIKD
jgi:hypothetical protein